MRHGGPGRVGGGGAGLPLLFEVCRNLVRGLPKLGSRSDETWFEVCRNCTRESMCSSHLAGFEARTSSASSTFPTAAAAAPPSSVVFTPRAFTPPSSVVLVVGRADAAPVDAAPVDGCKKLTLDWRGVVVVVMVAAASNCRGVVVVVVVVVVSHSWRTGGKVHLELGSV